MAEPAEPRNPRSRASGLLLGNLIQVTVTIVVTIITVIIIRILIIAMMKIVGILMYSKDSIFKNQQIKKQIYIYICIHQTLGFLHCLNLSS